MLMSSLHCSSVGAPLLARGRAWRDKAHTGWGGNGVGKARRHQSPSSTAWDLESYTVGGIWGTLSGFLRTRQSQGSVP